MSTNDDFLSQLERLNNLKNKGAISEAEFQKEKARLMQTDTQTSTPPSGYNTQVNNSTIPRQTTQPVYNRTRSTVNFSIASIISIIGGILAIIPVLPVISDFLPIIDVSNFYHVKAVISFWGENYDGTITHDVKGWTTLGIPPILMVIIFLAIGVVSIVFAINLSQHFLSIEDIIGNIIVLVAGIIDFIMIYLIYSGPFSSNSNCGFDSNFDDFTKYAGLGLWLLIIAGIILVIGGIVGLVKAQTATDA